jgi:hypothetical protein
MSKTFSEIVISSHFKVFFGEQKATGEIKLKMLETMRKRLRSECSGCEDWKLIGI